MGSHGQRFLLAVGLWWDTTHDHRKGDSGPRAVIVATKTGY